MVDYFGFNAVYSNLAQGSFTKRHGDVHSSLGTPDITQLHTTVTLSDLNTSMQ